MGVTSSIQIIIIGGPLFFWPLGNNNHSERVFQTNLAFIFWMVVGLTPSSLATALIE